MTDWKTVGARIRELREALGLTQVQLGTAVRTSANYVTKVEGGLGVSDTKLDAYAKALGVSVPFLRYGVSGGTEDIAVAREMGRAEERQRILNGLNAWAAQFVNAVPEPVHPAKITVIPETKATPKKSKGGDTAS